MATKKKATVEKEKEATVYIGKPRLGLPQYTVFQGGVIPPIVEELMKKDSSIAGLIVPVTELQAARENMLIKGHILNHYYTKQTTKEG